MARSYTSEKIRRVITRTGIDQATQGKASLRLLYRHRVGAHVQRNSPESWSEQIQSKYRNTKKGKIVLRSAVCKSIADSCGKWPVNCMWEGNVIEVQTPSPRWNKDGKFQHWKGKSKVNDIELNCTRVQDRNFCCRCPLPLGWIFSSR